MKTLYPAALIIPAVLLAPRPASACSPGIAQVVATSPADGAKAIPADTVIRLFAGDGYLDISDPDISVTADGKPVSGTASVWARAVDLISEQGVITFTPDALLAPGASVEVVLSDLKGGANIEFIVADSAASVADTAPELTLDALSHHTIDPNKKSSCDDEAWWEVSWSVALGNLDADELSMVEIHKVDVDWDGSSLGEPFRVIGPLGAASVATSSSRYRVDLSAGADFEGQCFVAVQRDGAGGSSPPSELVCGSAPGGDTGTPDDTGSPSDTGEDEDKEGCSVVSLSASLWGVIAGLVALGRRRRRA